METTYSDDRRFRRLSRKRKKRLQVRLHGLGIGTRYATKRAWASWWTSWQVTEHCRRVMKQCEELADAEPYLTVKLTPNTGPTDTDFRYLKLVDLAQTKTNLTPIKLPEI